jgi:RNA polymerase sigma factor, sigma-70 family
MSNEELVLQIQQGIDVDNNMALLYRQNKRFIYQIANKFKSVADIEDLEQEGYFGLCEAVKKYDVSKGFKFITYAGNWISQAMRRYMEKDNIVQISSQLYQRILSYKKTVSELTMIFGKPPTDWQVSVHMSLSEEQVKRIKDNLHLRSVGSVDKVIADESGELTLAETIASSENMENDVIDALVTEQLKECLWEAVDKLPVKEADVIKWRYQSNMTLKEAGERLGVSKERIRHIESKGLRNLRKPKVTRLLKEFDVIQTYAYGGGVSSFSRTWTSSTEYAAMKLWEQQEYIANMLSGIK